MKKDQLHVLISFFLLLLITIFLFIIIYNNNDNFFYQKKQPTNSKPEIIQTQKNNIETKEETTKTEEIKETATPVTNSTSQLAVAEKPTLISKIENLFSADEKTSSQKTIHNVPFTSQAPFAEWDDARQQDACEEASLIMAWHWIKNSTLSKTQAKTEILDLNAFMDKTLGQSTDTSAEDTLKIFKEYYKYDKADISYDVSIETIKNQLLKGNIVIVPTDGTVLKNPYYVYPGPTRHMIVIKGFDENKKQFITNDPGTRRGESFRYNYQTALNAIINYGTGDHAPLIDERKVMIVIKKI
jgi:hypothetical protein